jgi:NADH-quinone oxidoreductase subunit J
MAMNNFLFYFLSTIIVFSAAAILLVRNPIIAALSLAGTMVGLGFMYFLLQAPFIAAVQLIVYAGAVMVLFVMVIMLFDLQKETSVFSGGVLSRVIKLGCGMFFIGALVGAFANSWTLIPQVATAPMDAKAQTLSTKALAIELFTKYVFAFEALGILLLLIAVGVVAVSRAKGGTHARN